MVQNFHEYSINFFNFLMILQEAQSINDVKVRNISDFYFTKFNEPLEKIYHCVWVFDGNQSWKIIVTKRNLLAYHFVNEDLKFKGGSVFEIVLTKF